MHCSIYVCRFALRTTILVCTYTPYGALRDLAYIYVPTGGLYVLGTFTQARTVCAGMYGVQVAGHAVAKKIVSQHAGLIDAPDSPNPTWNGRVFGHLLCIRRTYVRRHTLSQSAGSGSLLRHWVFDHHSTRGMGQFSIAMIMTNAPEALELLKEGGQWGDLGAASC